MTALRQQMENDMVLRGMAVRTRQSYIEAVRGLARFYRRSPDRVAVGEVQSYLLHLLQERGLSHSTCNLVTNGLRFVLYLIKAGLPSFCWGRLCPFGSSIASRSGRARWSSASRDPKRLSGCPRS
jgi:hypothetical protein